MTPTPGAAPMPDPTKPSKVTTNPDGSTDIETPTLTPGTETTTTTASGEVNAKSHTGEEISGDQIDLNKELGETKPDWNTEKGKEFNGYKVSEVQPSDDGNSKTLTLTKTKHLDGKMGSEELAKFTNSTKKNNGDGTYDLVRTETYTDTDGQQRTRTTTLHVKDNEVTVDTTITLTVALEKGTHDASSDDISHVKLPDSITATDEKTGDTKTISAAELKRLMDSTTPTIEKAKKTYKVTEGDLEYTIEVDEEASRKLTNAEIFEKLDSSKYEYDKVTKKIYYIDKGERAELTKEQNDTLRKTLSYTVTVTETKKDGNLSYEGSKNEAEAFEKAATAAKTEARNKAVESALKELKLNDAQVQQALKNGTFDDTNRTFTYTLGGKTYTLSYTEPTAIESSTPTPMPNAQDTIDTQQHTVTGMAQVTNGTVSWKDSGSGSGSYAASSGDPWPVPKGATVADTKHEGSKTITTYQVTSADGKTVTTYVVTEEEVQLGETEKERIAWDNLKDRLELDQNLTPEQLQSMGYSISGVTFTGSTKNISWTATKTVTGTKTDTTDDADSYREISLNDSIQKKDDGTYSIRINGQLQSGFTSTDGETFTKKDGDKTITVTAAKGDALKADAIKTLISQKYKLGDSIQLTVDTKNQTASYKDSDGKIHTFHYSDAVTQNISVKEETKENINKTTDKALIEAVQKKLDALNSGDELKMSGKKEYTVKKNADGSFTISGGGSSTSDTIKDAAEVTTKITTIIKEIASNYINYGDLSGKDIWNLLDIQQVYADGKDNEYITSDKDCTDSYWPEDGYQNIHHWDGNVSYGETGQPTTTFGHMSLDAEVSIKDEKSGKTYDDGLILSEGLTFKYGHKEEIAGWCDKSKYPDKSYMGTTTYDKDYLHKTTGAKDASLSKDITVRDGQIWNGTNYVGTDSKLTYSYTDEESNAFAGKRFYNISGQVAYDRREQTTNETIANAKLDELIADGLKEAQIVSYKDQYGQTVYNVYAYVTNLNAIGYMTASANTSANQDRYGYNWQERRWDNWTPGCGSPYFGNTAGGDYDLRIQGLKLVDGQVQGNYGVKYSLGLTTTRTANATDNILTVDKTTTTTITPTSVTEDLPGGNRSTTNGSFSYGYTQYHTDTLGSQTTGTGTGIYTSFRKLFTNAFTGNGTGHEDSGSFRYTYRTEKDAELAPVNKVTQVDKTAHITYDRTTVESRDVLIPDTEIVHIDPDGGGDDDDNGIIDENTPDSPVLPGTPELPPVQDARPDAPVLPSDPVLPPVQDARIDASALPQTGVNWLTAIGLALSGMTLMATGAFATLTGKSKKEQQ